MRRSVSAGTVMLIFSAGPKKRSTSTSTMPPCPTFVFLIRLPFTHGFCHRQILFLFSQDFTVNLDSLARVVEGFLDRVAGAKAARKIRNHHAERCLLRSCFDLQL